MVTKKTTARRKSTRLTTAKKSSSKRSIRSARKSRGLNF